MKKCNEIIELIDLYADGKLDESQKNVFEEHIGTCSECRGELDETLQVISICSQIPEEDLPEGFKEKLHSNLEAENIKAENKRKLITITNRYLKVVSSIAAVLILVFVTKGFLLEENLKGVKGEMSKASQKNSTANSLINEESGSLTYSMEDSIVGGKADTTDSYGVLKPSESVDGGAVVRAVEKLEALGMYEDKAKEEKVENNTAKDTPKTLVNSEVKSNKTEVNEKKPVVQIVHNSASIAFVSDKSPEFGEKIRTTAAKFGEEVLQKQDTIALASTPKLAKSFRAAEAEEQIKTYTFRIPASKYEAFLKAVSEGISQEAIIGGKVNSEDASSELSTVDKSIEELRGEIAELELSSSNRFEELEKLKIEAERLQAERDRIIEESNYIIVTIDIKPK